MTLNCVQGIGGQVFAGHKPWLVFTAAALGLAALHSGVWVPRKDEVVCLILCGANMDPGTLVPVSA